MNQVLGPFSDGSLYELAPTDISHGDYRLTLCVLVVGILSPAFPGLLTLASMAVNVALPIYGLFVDLTINTAVNYLKIFLLLHGIKWVLGVENIYINIVHFFYEFRLLHPRTRAINRHFQAICSWCFSFAGFLKDLFPSFSASDIEQQLKMSDFFPLPSKLDTITPHTFFWMLLAVLLFLGLFSTRVLNGTYYTFTVALPLYLWLRPDKLYVVSRTDSAHESHHIALFSHQKLQRNPERQTLKSEYWGHFFAVRLFTFILIDWFLKLHGCLAVALQTIFFFSLAFPKPGPQSKRVLHMITSEFFIGLLKLVYYISSFIIFGDDEDAYSSNPNYVFVQKISPEDSQKPSSDNAGALKGNGGQPDTTTSSDDAKSQNTSDPDSSTPAASKSDKEDARGSFSDTGSTKHSPFSITPKTFGLEDEKTI